MSVYTIYLVDGAKMMRPVASRAEYLALRDGGKQKDFVRRIRQGEEQLKQKLVQMSYSCLPNADGSLKGSTTLSTTIGMDVDHIPPEEMEPVRQRILAKAEALGLKMLEKSARGSGYHLVFARHAEMSNEGNLRWASDLLGVKYDSGAKDITRIFYTTTGSAEDLIFLDDSIFEVEAAEVNSEQGIVNSEQEKKAMHKQLPAVQKQPGNERTRYIFEACMRECELTPEVLIVEGARHEAVKSILSVGATQLLTRPEFLGVLSEMMPDNWQDENIQTLVNDFYLKYHDPSQKMTQFQRKVFARSQRKQACTESQPTGIEGLDSNLELPYLVDAGWTKKMPQGVRDSINAVGQQLIMPVITAICPCIGALATGVKLDVHGQRRGLNLIAYITGEYASCKGSIDPIIEAWMSELRALDKMYQNQEDDWRAKKLAAKNQKHQPEEPKLPFRLLTLNNTVANLAERLANTEDKHAFSFTPEADTVAQKWKQSMSDFSVMLRQAYDGSRYDREARSVEAVNVHIEHLLWNVTMCGTPDALYRVVSNYTDGFQSRIALASMPDNTFVPLDDKPHVLTTRQTERIQQIAHLLPLMQGEVVLPKLEAQGRQWVERIRLETMKNDDKVRARQRFRICVTTQRMICCLMLCKVCEGLIQKHGLNGAESLLKQQPDLWKAQLAKAQTPQMLAFYDTIADALLENALTYFRQRIEHAYGSRDYVIGNSDRQRPGKNDSIYERLDLQFTFEQAKQHSIAVKGAGVTHNQVRQMLKNWRKQGLIVQTENGKFRKLDGYEKRKQ